MVTIICVLKTGGDFDREYVVNLYGGCKRNIKEKFIFLCLTDDEVFTKEGYKDIRFSPLQNGYQGWWNKIEIFKVVGTCLYIDLDTVIIFNLDDVISLIKRLREDEFLGIKAFNPQRRAIIESVFLSGIMGWNGDFRFILDNFNYEEEIKINNPYYVGDQGYISKVLRQNLIKLRFCQDEFPGLYSFKMDCKNGMPEDAKIICFQNKPRPRDVEDLDWMKVHWKGE